MGEAHLPTQHTSPGQEARFPAPDEHPSGSGHPEEPPGQGSPPVVGVSAPFSGRGDFQRLRAEGRRYGSGVTWCVHRADASRVPPRVAFAIGRHVGPAVVRNRIRRRLRAILREVALAPGDYLFGVSADARSVPFEQLQRMVIAVLARFGSGSGR